MSTLHASCWLPYRGGEGLFASEGVGPSFTEECTMELLSFSNIILADSGIFILFFEISS